MEKIDSTYSLEQKLDMILDNLRGQPGYSVMNTKQIGSPFSDLGFVRKINPTEFDFMLETLEEHGFIIIDKSAGNHPIVKLTYKGYFFGGFNEQKKRKEADIKRRDRFDRQLSYGTVFLAVATVLLVCIEFFRLYMQYFSCHCHQ